MKSFNQFLSESITINGDFNGTLNIGGQPESQQVGEEYCADILWNGNLYRLDLTTKSGIPNKRDLGEQIQGEYPGAVVQQIYPVEEKNLNIKNVKRYHPAKLEWI